MTQAYTGMRKGISLVEMVIAIILFATLATITIKYSKQYLDTDLQAKRARVATLTEQANTLIHAHQLFKVDFSRDITAINELNQTSGILTEIPTTITEIGGAASTGWGVDTATLIPNHPTAFTFALDTTAGNTDNEKNCALFNHEFNSSIELNVTATQTFFKGAGPTVLQAYTLSGNKPAFCWSSAADTHVITVLAY